MARILGLLLTIVPLGIVVALFWYWMQRRMRRDRLKEEQKERRTK